MVERNLSWPKCDNFDHLHGNETCSFGRIDLLGGFAFEDEMEVFIQHGDQIVLRRVGVDLAPIIQGRCFLQ